MKFVAKYLKKPVFSLSFFPNNSSCSKNDFSSKILKGSREISSDKNGNFSFINTKSEKCFSQFIYRKKLLERKNAKKNLREKWRKFTGKVECDLFLANKTSSGATFKGMGGFEIRESHPGA